MPRAAPPNENEYVVSIKRTASTAPYETVTVEITTSFEASDSSAFGAAYKALSSKVEKAVNHEIAKYKPGKKKVD